MLVVAIELSLVFVFSVILTIIKIFPIVSGDSRFNYIWKINHNCIRKQAIIISSVRIEWRFNGRSSFHILKCFELHLDPYAVIIGMWGKILLFKGSLKILPPPVILYKHFNAYKNCCSHFELFLLIIQTYHLKIYC